VIFSADTEKFYCLEVETSEWKEMSDALLDVNVLEFLAGKGRAADTKGIQGWLDARIRKKIIAELKTVALRKVPRQRTVGGPFVLECLEENHGSTVTTPELGQPILNFASPTT